MKLTREISLLCFSSLDQKCTISLHSSFRTKSDIIHLLSKEIPPKRVTFMEELGRGAFGKVHKGVLKDLPKAEVFFKPREERVEVNEGKVVAIKVLLGEQE